MPTNFLIVKRKTPVFEAQTKVQYITCTYSGRCYLVADLNEDLKREWLMDYDLEPEQAKE